MPKSNLDPVCQCERCRVARARLANDGFGYIVVIAGVILAALLLWALATFDRAHSQASQCLPVEIGLQLLKESADESIRYRAALDPSGHELLVTVAPSGSWSILVVNDAGLACMAAAGSKWRDAAR